MQILGVQTGSGPFVLWDSGDASLKVSCHTHVRHDIILQGGSLKSVLPRFLRDPYLQLRRAPEGRGTTEGVGTTSASEASF